MTNRTIILEVGPPRCRLGLDGLAKGEYGN
jgi:hypothetical protein